MNRTQAREWMMQVYYQMDVNKDFDPEDEDKLLMKKNLGDQEDYCRALYRILLKYRGQIDRYIDEYSIGWKASRMAKTDIAVLRLSAAEILYMDDIPTAVSINEAVDLAKKYGTEEGPRFINGILAKIAKIKPEHSGTSEEAPEEAHEEAHEAADQEGEE
jgi:N utilization substance protein B